MTTNITSVTRRNMLLTAGTAVAVTAMYPVFGFAAKSDSATTATEGTKAMSTVTTRDGTEIFYKDWGPKDAQPIVFHHGWPLSSDDWDAQMLFFVSKGFRVVAHD
ncbi:alpha/beta fold hydrolase, partial [Agrobacterium pusense]|uniref:alpha/beta fold hydrolase n=1 Tax=Agrobacterium pusense TaxID=648995 RepID=UPI001C6F310D